MTSQGYRQTSDRFLTQAREELAIGNLRKASGNEWDAAVHMLKAIAYERSWEHSKHRDHQQAVSGLRSETADAEIRMFFNSACGLRENSYDSFMSPEEVSDGLDDVQVLLDKIRVLLL